MKYYLGGYYLMQLRPHPGTQPGEWRYIYTCSSCINVNCYDPCLDDAREISALPDEEERAQHEIWEQQSGSGTPFVEIGLQPVFSSLEAVRQYKDEHFAEKKELAILGLFFSEAEHTRLIDTFGPAASEIAQFGQIGLRKNLRRRIPEDDTGRELGYDLIGIENTGDLHTFHCNLTERFLQEQFGLKINRWGLIGHCTGWEPIMRFCNENEGEGVEPVPWFYAKVKLFE